MDKFLKDNKIILIVGALLLLGIVVFSVMSGGSQFGAVGGAVDSSKAVTTSQDNISGSAVKMGNIGSVEGGLNMSRTTTTVEKKEDNEESPKAGHKDEEK